MRVLAAPIVRDDPLAQRVRFTPSNPLDINSSDRQRPPSPPLAPGARGEALQHEGEGRPEPRYVSGVSSGCQSSTLFPSQSLTQAKRP
jgi:hypothetical protein